MKGLLLAAITMLAANGLMAQTYSETAGMFSRTRPTGTARILGMGGANVSLGGDLSSAYSNPAGLGMFNHSEFSITPGYTSFRNYNGDYYSGNTLLSSNNGDVRTGINVPNFGLAFSKPQNDEGFIRGTFAISMTRINDFNSNLHYEGGPNPNTSIIDYFINQANGYPNSQFDQGGDLDNTVTQLGYFNYLIEPNDPNNNNATDYYSVVGGQAYQSESIQTKGAQNQWNFSYGANFNDKFFLGAGLGIVGLNYQSTKSYTETFNDGGPLNNLHLTEDLRIKGTGINLSVGAIVRPVAGLQIGANITTPTRYNLNDNYSATMSTSWNNYDYFGDNSQILSNESASTQVVSTTYVLTTPMKFAVGASYIFGKVGLLSLDVERVNYSKAKYQSQTTDVSFTSDNDDIKNTYVGRTNIRLGGEIRVKDFRFRAGAGLMPDFVNQRPTDTSNTWSTASVGVGYRKAKWYVDLAYVQTFASGNWPVNGNSITYSNASANRGNVYIPYSVDNGPGLLYNQQMQNVMATVGFTF